MHISENGIKLIKQFEDCRLNAYKCPAGIWTIGFGHTGNIKPGMTITQKDADALLLKDLERYEQIVYAYDSIYHWTQNEFDALVSFAYNIGSITGLTAAGTRTKKQIANKMLLYVNANGIPLKGLITRRNAEHDLFCSIAKSIDDIAHEVIDGLWGNGRTRTTNLKKAGYDPKIIQKRVNELLSMV